MRKLAAVLLALAASPLFAQNVTHGSVSRQPASGNLRAQIEGSSSLWIGYSVPALAGRRYLCSLDSIEFRDEREGDLTPAAPSTIAIWYRIANHHVDTIRVYSPDCPLDAHNAAVTWIESVDPRASVTALASLVDDGEGSRKNHALSAIALHADDSATDRLIALLDSRYSDELRAKAAFWLGASRGARGYDAVKRLVESRDTSGHVRSKAVFAMMQSREPRRIDDVIAIAKHDPETRVRTAALFWLAQTAGRKVADTLRDAVDNDPDTAVKEKAVFAISQMPDDESIPMLIDLLRHHKNPSVRKKAAFWLGQKSDPRALKAIEDILKE